MIKLFAVMTALCLILTTTAFAGEDAGKTYADEHPGVLAFDSFWVSGDGHVRIDAGHTDGGYEIAVAWMTGGNTFTSWEYLLTYDEETESLVADRTGMKSANVFDETGTVTRSKVEYEDGSARFFINDRDQLCWLDERESAFDTVVFNRIGRFPGVYTGGQAKLKVSWAGEGVSYDVQLEMPESASQTWFWSWSGKFDPAANALVLNGSRLLYTFKAYGELDPDADRLEEEVFAVFTFDNEGFLVCNESTDPAIMGIRFWLDPESRGMWTWEF